MISIAAVRGRARGVGSEFALACDLRFASLEKAIFGQPEVGSGLIDHDGRRRTDAQFRGKLLVLYFGYTYCPDVCPTDLMAISSAIDLLGPAGNNVQPIFITIDPQRDTVEHLRRYVSTFHPRLIGLTGSEHDIRTLALAYKVYYAKIAAEHGEPYAIYHTGFIYLVDRNGKYLGIFFHPVRDPTAWLR